MIQIYCTVVDDTTATFTWTLNGSSLLNDPPHICIRENNLPERSASLLTDDSTSVLTVDNLRASDNGVYQCTATSGATSGNGTAVTLTGMCKCICNYNYNYDVSDKYTIAIKLIFFYSCVI